MNKIDLEELNQKRGVLKKAVEEEKKYVSIIQALNLSSEALLKHEQSLPFIKITQGEQKKLIIRKYFNINFVFFYFYSFCLIQFSLFNINLSFLFIY